MEKDLKSFHRHDAQYRTTQNMYDETLSGIEYYDKTMQFERMGFKMALDLTSNKPKIHIDIGSGNGWLLRKTSPYFEKVIGIEPSHTATETCKKVYKEIPNISLINADMCDGLDELKPTEPVFLTTSVVLSHIEDFYVADFLNRVNDLPIGSAFCFAEAYDTNHNWKYWHIRNKDWWIKNLPNWQLLFLNLEIDGYAHSIYGVCMGKKEVRKQKLMSFPQRISWNLSVLYHQGARVIRKLRTLFK